MSLNYQVFKMQGIPTYGVETAPSGLFPSLLALTIQYTSLASGPRNGSPKVEGRWGGGWAANAKGPRRRQSGPSRAFSSASLL